ncbi:hypothetical protein [Polyangium spumosum]|uniref:Transcriptional regulator n=1 Tax=Polyangium spumosum TaxID=889282 RepID=A0A6N7PQZ7_9BACT|nr:hypothetical protein [Polyangium spumosum]MRG92544.1 hypothetical protein [Polyangium spumosum]
MRAAERNIARAYGGRTVLASVMGVSKDALNNIVRGSSYAVAVLLARAGGITVEQVLSGRPHVAGACSLCGRKGGAS